MFFTFDPFQNDSIGCYSVWRNRYLIFGPDKCCGVYWAVSLHFMRFPSYGLCLDLVLHDFIAAYEVLRLFCSVCASQGKGKLRRLLICSDA
jgi:hypothetical protein